MHWGRRAAAAALALTALASAAQAQGASRAYGGRSEDNLLEMTQAGSALFAVGTTASTDGDLSMRRRTGFTGWATLIDEDGTPLWSYASAHTGFDRMISPAALEDGRLSLVLTDRQAQGGEWLLLGSNGALLARVPIPSALCGDGKSRSVCRMLACDQSPAALAVFLSGPEPGMLQAGRMDERGETVLGMPFEGDAQGCAASDLRGGLAWIGARDGALCLTRFDGAEAVEMMTVAFGAFEVERIGDALMLDDGSVACCGEAQDGAGGFLVRVSGEGEVLFARALDGAQRQLCQTETGLAVYGLQDSSAAVSFFDEDGNLQGVEPALRADAQDLAGTPDGAALLVHLESLRDRQAVITRVQQRMDALEAQQEDDDGGEALPAAAGPALDVAGSHLLCSAAEGRGVQVTYVDELGRERWSTRMPIHTAADALEWLCAVQLEDGRILLGGRYLSGEGEAARQQGALALLGSDGVLRSMEAVPGCGAVCAMEALADGTARLSTVSGSAPGLVPDAQMAWPL